MIPGTKLALGDKEFIIPPLSLGQLRAGLSEKIGKHDELVQKGDVDYTELLMARGEIILSALRRNYPESELPDGEIWDRLDFKNVPLAWQAVLGLSGFDISGEVEAARQDGQTTASSLITRPLPPPTDGLTQ